MSDRYWREAVVRIMMDLECRLFGRVHERSRPERRCVTLLEMKGALRIRPSAADPKADVFQEQMFWTGWRLIGPRTILWRCSFCSDKIQSMPPLQFIHVAAMANQLGVAALSAGSASGRSTCRSISLEAFLISRSPSSHDCGRCEAVLRGFAAIGR
jgi:hypothetical protein